MVRFAKSLKLSLKFEPIILDLNHNYAEICDHKNIADHEGLYFITPMLRKLVIRRHQPRKNTHASTPNDYQTNTKKQQIKRTFIGLLKSKLRSLLGIPFLFFISLLDFSNILRRSLPKLIVLPEDIVGVDTPLIIKLAQSKNIPSFILLILLPTTQKPLNHLKIWHHTIQNLSSME